ncbi:MAG: methyltransferase domain-containing protein [Crocinitomix sp.]|nr:methyltransferase domain-containing protein [Crocinitomix sp.]
MCDKIDFSTAKNIVELGPGTGVFTEELLKRASKDCRIFVIELNEEFYIFLKKKFNDPRIVLLKESADNLDDILERNGVAEVDAVLSSLPLTVIPDQIRKRIIIKSYEALKTGGVYVQYQYSLNAKKLIEKKFGKLKMGFVAINIPPAFVYLGTK